MFEKKVKVELEGYKPNMEALTSIGDLPLVKDTVLMSKADGEFSFVAYRKGRAFTVNRYGHLRMDFPALNELSQKLSESGIREAGFLAELYAFDEKPLKLPQYIHYAKSKDESLIAKLHLGIFDLISVHGKEVYQSYDWKLGEMQNWFVFTERAYILPYRKVSSQQEAQQFWNSQVEEKGYEGLVAHSGTKLFKIKPVHPLDAVIIGINKKPLYKQQLVTSLKLALMDTDGSLIEIGDVASGIDKQLRQSLWQLTQFKVTEDKKTLYVQPLVVVTVEYTDIYHTENNTRYAFTDRYTQKGTAKLVRLRHPRLIEIRQDKKVNPQDLRLTQIPQ